MTIHAPETFRLLPAHRSDLADHRRRYGNAGWPGTREQLVEAVESAGLRGRGGGGYPLAAKLRAIDVRRRPVVVANGCEADPLSEKDDALLALAPHLVLDGLAVAAFATGARTAVLCLPEGSRAERSVRDAIAERTDVRGVRLVILPRRYVAGEESALVHFLDRGDARPTVKPPRPGERGVRGRPTLVSNVETLARLAVLAGRGPGSYPGTSLLTVSGEVRRPGVYELPVGIRIGAVLEIVGTVGTAQAVLVGGSSGTWVPLPAAATHSLEHDALRAAGIDPGIGALFVLSEGPCGLRTTATILAYLAEQSARQCGPCMFGLPAIAADLQQLVDGRQPDAAWDRLRRRLPLLPGRGACAHPDGAVRMTSSALRTFRGDVEFHLAGGRH